MLRNDKIYRCKDNYLNKDEIPPRYIPKKIFQLIDDKTKLNKNFQDNIDFIKKNNPDWTYTLLDNKDIEEYLKRHYAPIYFQYYQKINPKYGAARADFFRYLLMWREGGAYFDIKSAPNFPLNKILHPDDEYIISIWAFPNQFSKLKNTIGEYQQWHIICRPQHPYLKVVIENVMKNIDDYDLEKDGVGKDSVLKITGPIAYTKAIHPILNDHNHKFFEYTECLGLIYNNIGDYHENKFAKKHYSEIKEPLIIK